MADHLFARSFDQSELRDQFLREGGMAKIMGFSSLSLASSLLSPVIGEEGATTSEDKRRRQLETDQLNDRRGRPT